MGWQQRGWASAGLERGRVVVRVQRASLAELHRVGRGLVCSSATLLVLRSQNAQTTAATHRTPSWRKPAVPPLTPALQPHSIRAYLLFNHCPLLSPLLSPLLFTYCPHAASPGRGVPRFQAGREPALHGGQDGRTGGAGHQVQGGGGRAGGGGRQQQGAAGGCRVGQRDMPMSLSVLVPRPARKPPPPVCSHRHALPTPA